MRAGPDVREGEVEQTCVGETVAEPLLERGKVLSRVNARLLGGGLRPRHRTGLNSRLQRTVQGHSQTFQAGCPSPLEKKMSSARPIRFCAGT